jgi:glycine hydroxymethyltransferase
MYYGGTMKDKQVEKIIRGEEKRLQDVLELIASENIPSQDVHEAEGSILGVKYGEGYTGARYYEGCEFVDKIETLAIQRAFDLFLGKKYIDDYAVNVQATSGTIANNVIYDALVSDGGKIMGMKLEMGGHLSHGEKMSATSKRWNWVKYELDKSSEVLDYDVLMAIAKKEKPDMIVAGYSAYSRIIDFLKMKKIADAIDAFLMIDMSHFAGLVAGGVYPSPFPYADVVMSTTHKTLRGPRGALIFSRKEFAPLINKSVFPGYHGGPHFNTIAGIAVMLKEDSTLAFKKYAKQVVKNAVCFATELASRGWRIISGGTDSHLFLVDVYGRGITGGEASCILNKANIVTNKNTIPFDTRKPKDPSGIRIGTPIVTTRGMKEKEMKAIADMVDRVLTGVVNPATVRKEVLALTKKFPLRV